MQCIVGKEIETLGNIYVRFIGFNHRGKETIEILRLLESEVYVKYQACTARKLWKKFSSKIYQLIHFKLLYPMFLCLHLHNRNTDSIYGAV